MVGLKLDDVIIKINNEESSTFNLAEATEEIGKGTEKLDLTIERLSHNSEMLISSFDVLRIFSELVEQERSQQKRQLEHSV